MDDLAKQIAEKVTADTKYFTAVIGFVGVILGALTTIIGNIILHKLGAKKERQQEILKRELDRLYKLEEIAGEITEWASSYQLDNTSNGLQNRFHSFCVAAGTFRKYPKLKQAIRDLNQCAMIIVDEGKNGFHASKEKRELEEKYQIFLNEFEAVLNGIKT
ncbi:MAG: hypothetical protein JEZ02_16545 [Desulfatibacillum sp.]|nr:hypothetical protein [Desulfatibacillum sp.]